MLLHRFHLARLSLAVPLVLGTTPAPQSGRGTMHGYVAFEDVSYNDVTQGAIKAKIELRGSTEYNKGSLYSAETNNRGAYDIPAIGAGEFTLTISAPGYATYHIAVYIPSDFECRLATMLKKKPGSEKGELVRRR